MTKNPHAVVLGRRGGKIGGKSTSKAKAAASRANGKLRSRTYPPCPLYRAHRFWKGKCPCGYKRVTWIKFVKQENA